MKIRFDGENMMLTNLKKPEAVLLAGFLNLDCFLDGTDSDSIEAVFNLNRAAEIDTVADAINQLSHEIACDSIYDEDDDEDFLDSHEIKGDK